MRILSILALAFAAAACAPPPQQDIFAAVESLNLGQPLGDANNFCNNSPLSAHISLPADDALHYPDRVTDQSRANFQPGTAFGSTGFESTFKFWHGEMLANGHLVRVHGYRAYFALLLPPIFGPGTGGWYRLLLVDLVSDLDHQQHQYAYLAPGEYANAANGYDMQIGGPGEFLVIDAATLQPLADPTVVIGHATGSGGANLVDYFRSADGQFAVSMTSQELGRPSYPFDDGAAPAAFAPWSFYWARTQLAAAGTVTYGGVSYPAAATSWEERQWPGSGPLFKWRWLSVQVKGCLDGGNRKIPCAQGGLLGVAGRTIAAFDIQTLADGQPAIHDWTEVGPVPSCEAAHLTGVSDWTLSVLDSYTSARPTFVCSNPTDPSTCVAKHGRYARQVELTAPSRGVDLTATAVADDQETYLVSNFYPGSWEGAMDVTGTINGQRVWGDAYLEQFLQPLVP